MGFPIQVASRYAKSLLSLAIEKGLVDEFKKDLATYMEVFYQNYDFNLLMHSPIVQKSKKIAIVKAIFADKISDTMLSYFTLIIKKGREDGLDEISTQFLRQYDVLKAVKKATVISAQPLTTDARAKINKQLTDRYNKTIELKEEVDPTLIGGYILRIDDTQIDNSIKTQLRKLKDSIS